MFILFQPQMAMADCLVMEEFGYALMVEPEVDVKETSAMVSLDFSPGGRSPKMLILAGGLNSTAFAETTTSNRTVLPNGVTVKYDTQLLEAVGSGGAEFNLFGVLDTEPPLMVSCHMQGEHPNPEWCLPILGKIRPMTDGCATGDQ